MRFAPNDVAAGRAYVEAYVTYIHNIERLYEGAEKSLQVIIRILTEGMSSM